MPFVNIKLVDGVFTEAQKHAMAADITDVMVKHEGSEAFRDVVWVLLEELHTDGWHIGGEPFRGPKSLMDQLGRAKATYESIDGHPTSRQEWAAAAPVKTHDENATRPSQDDPSTPDQPGQRSENALPARVPDVIRSFFHFDALRNVESLVGLFADDATVLDEGVARHGATEIRAWQTGAASEYTYTTDIFGYEALAADHYVVKGRLEGNFPGGTADLAYDFTVNGRISHLAIAPPAS